ncbi:helix-turn-helix domain-containing protein [Cupriavidus pauculus]|uniref:HTH araC/xylS-type domain-containing protein n=1 Tax=Cupriavidus pauculus TaxID=82633 RepID=A0A2N5CDZ9_9BURK|nr:helix-turn-helix domain-containing protein [Cupriavidus pauculus]PLQ00434.1 hypothetical protein CYJ10_12480 [Cupriavidus pauculus]
MRAVQSPLQSPVSLSAASFAEWGEAISTNFLPLDCSRPAGGRFYGRANLAHFAQSVVGDIEVGAHRVTRRCQHAEASDAGYFKIFWQLSGRSVIAQRGREAALLPGHWSIYDTAQPYSVDMDEGCRALVLLVPQMRGFGWEAATRELCGSALPGMGAARIAASALRGLLHDTIAGHQLDHRAQAVLEDSMVALLETALHGAMVPDGVATHQRLGKNRVRSMVEYIDAQLHDPELSAQHLAAIFHVSRRTLYNLFREFGQTPHAYIQSRRLDRAAQRLSDPVESNCSITQIAFGLGFADAAHFSRVFHERFGVTPSQWRMDKNAGNIAMQHA